MIRTNPSFIVELEKKSIKKEFNINDIEKKFDFIKKNYTSEIISVNLTDLYSILILRYNVGYYRYALNFFFLISGYIKLAFVNKFTKKKKYSVSNLIIFCKHKYVDQFNFSETSNFLLKKNKKHLVVLSNTKDDFERISRLYQSKNIVNLRNFLNFSGIIKSIIRFSFQLSTINKIISVLNCKKLRFEVYQLFFVFFIKSEMWSNLIKENKIKKMFLTNFLGDTALIYLNKIKNKKIEFIGYGIHGVDAISSRYVYHNLDKFLVLGKTDIQIMEETKKIKLRFMSLPKKTLIVGSTRHDYFFKKLSIKKKEKNSFKILYIKSNPIYLDGLDDKAFILFSKMMKKFKEIKYTIKDREKFLSPTIQKLIDKRIIKKRYIEKSGPIEESICNVDLCVGTNSTALLRQAIFLNKPIIQLYAKEHFMWDTSKTLTSVNNEKQIFFLIKKLSSDKKFYNKYFNLNKKMKKYILSNELKANKKIYEILK
jgi:hypothetical protein